MKQCPVCRRTYQEQNATHCISDGTPLVPAFDNGGSELPPTMWSGSASLNTAPANSNPVNNPPAFQTSPPQFSTPTLNNPPKSSNSKLLLILAGVGVALVLLVGFLGVAGFVIYQNYESSDYTNSNTGNNNSTVVKTTGSYNPYNGVLKDIIPKSVGNYSMWKDIEPYTIASPGKKEEVSAYYETTDGTRAVLTVKNFVSTEEANKGLLLHTKTLIDVWKPTEKGNATQVIKNGQVVGTMVTIYATDPYGSLTDIVSWTNGSLLSQVIIRKRRGEGKRFFDSMPF
jgi:hypothetical protein